MRHAHGGGIPRGHVLKTTDVWRVGHFWWVGRADSRMLKTLCCSLALKKHFRSVFDGLTCFECPFWRMEDGCLICLYSSLLAFFCWVESVVSCRNGLNKVSNCQLWWLKTRLSQTSYALSVWRGVEHRRCLFCRVSRHHLSSNPATFQFRPEALIEWAYTNKGLSQMSGTQPFRISKPDDQCTRTT